MPATPEIAGESIMPHYLRPLRDRMLPKACLKTV